MSLVANAERQARNLLEEIEADGLNNMPEDKCDCHPYAHLSGYHMTLRFNKVHSTVLFKDEDDFYDQLAEQKGN